MKSQWKADIMEVSKYDLERAYIATGAVTNADHTSAIMHRWTRMAGTNWITAVEMDCGRRWIAAGDGWMTGGG